MAVAPADLVAQPRTVPGHVGRKHPGLTERPADTTVPADDRGLVGDGENGGETDAETADGLLVVPLGRGPQRGQGLHARRVERGAGVGGDEDTVAEGEPQPPGNAGAGGGVRGVLRELHDEPVPVPAEDQILLGVGVLAETGRAGRPGIHDASPETGGPEGVRPLGRGPHELTHVDSPHRRDDEGTAQRGGAARAVRRPRPGQLPNRAWGGGFPRDAGRRRARIDLAPATAVSRSAVPGRSRGVSGRCPRQPGVLPPFGSGTRTAGRQGPGTGTERRTGSAPLGTTGLTARP